AELVRSGGEVRAAIAALPHDAEALLARWRAGLAAGRRTAIQQMIDESAWRAAHVAFWQLAPNAPPGDKLGNQFHQLAALLRDLDAARADFADDERLAALGGINLAGGAMKDWGSKERVAEARECLRSLRDGYRKHAALLDALWDEALERRAATA